MSLLRRLFIFLLVLPWFALAAEPALKPGESLTFRVSWGVFQHAGDITITAGSTAAIGKSAPQLQVITTTATRGVARALYKFQARAESLYDPATGRLLLINESSETTDKQTKISTSFDYLKHNATYTNAKDSGPVVLTMPGGEPQDLIMSLVQTRRWDLKPGEHRDALVIFGDDFYELTIYAERYEEVKTPLGTFKTLMLVPRMEKTPPKGMFRKGGAVRVWISQDDQRLPVKFQVDFKFGAGVATLSAYQPSQAAGSSAPAKETPATSPTPSAKDAKNSRP
ncbi:MAG: DUF3108 domain-containing protein [Opitutaceae bacterium]